MAVLILPGKMYYACLITVRKNNLLMYKLSPEIHKFNHINSQQWLVESHLKASVCCVVQEMLLLEDYQVGFFWVTKTVQSKKALLVLSCIYI